MTNRLELAFKAIDNANGEDPTLHADGPLAQVQGIRATHWTHLLAPNAPDALRIATRAHHLRRWELKRASYPEGRAGYLKWRRENKQHQANEAAEIVRAVGYHDEVAERTTTLLLRKELNSDPDTQVLEDAACLVFLETQYEGLIARLDREKAVGAVAKTLKKMSPAAIELSGSIELSGNALAILGEAAATLQR